MTEIIEEASELLSHPHDRAVIVSLEMLESEAGDLAEFCELVTSAGVEIATTITGSRQTAHHKYFVGTGKAEEICQAVQDYDANVILINHDLTPSQNRNLESLCDIRVVDRTGLILDIFAQRAQSFEGKLQVELAQLTRLATRLVRKHTNLSQQRGGAVGLRGPGETRLEMDRRVISDRIRQLKKRLESVTKMRAQERISRERNEVPTVALVGYTNAGKSSLFNALTDAGVYVQDQLFATLDPTHRAIEIPHVGRIVLVDTVGFISKLPHDLVEAFKSTLQEAVEADLLLEVIDVADKERELKMREVSSVLEQIKADQVSRLQVFNKIDLKPEINPHISKDEHGLPTAVWLSVVKKEGLTLLIDAIATHFQQNHLALSVTLPPSEGRLRAELYRLDAVKDEQFGEKGEFILELYLARYRLMRLLKEMPETSRYFTSVIS